MPFGDNLKNVTGWQACADLLLPDRALIWPNRQAPEPDCEIKERLKVLLLLSPLRIFAAGG